MWQRIDIGSGDVQLWPGYLEARQADRLLTTLRETVPWQADTVRVFGREHPIPRLHQWYGDAGTEYQWSGLTMSPLAWTPELDGLRRQLERDLEREFNSALANLYRDGNDSMGWHADNEAELGSAPVIASVSLGAERDLQFRRAGETRTSLNVPLPHGSLLVMAGDTQCNWQHALPRRRRVRAPRINLTFRRICRG